MTRKTQSILLFSLAGVLAIGVYFASPNRYPEPTRTDKEEEELVQTLQHIYGRIKAIDTDSQTITLTYNTSYINRWRPTNLPFPERKGQKTILLDENTTILTYQDPEAGYFPLNTFPYTNQEYQDVITFLLQEKTLSSSLSWQDLQIDQGVTIVSSEKTFTSDDILPANLIIARDTDYQDMEAIAVPMIYPIIFLLFSIGIQNLFPQKPMTETIVRLTLATGAMLWYLMTTFLTL
jgi:hypothetical protein